MPCTNLGGSSSIGAPLGAKALVMFMKLGRGIPYEVNLKEERDAGASFGRRGSASIGH